MVTQPLPSLLPAPQAALNRGLLHVVSALSASRGSGLLTLRSGGVERSLWVRRGCLVATGSNLESELLGQMLAAEGKLDPDLIDPLALEAHCTGRSFGEQLVVDRLLTPAEVAAALERQAELRFHEALLMPGQPRLDTVLPPALEVAQLPLGALLIGQFRGPLDLAAIEGLIADQVPGKAWMWIESSLLEGVPLQPWEARLVNRANREPFEARELMQMAGTSERATRLLAALVALHAISFETEKSRALATARHRAVLPKVIALGS